MTKQECKRSVIIGLYRQGNPIEKIMWIMELPYLLVEQIINDYKIKVGEEETITHPQY